MKCEIIYYLQWKKHLSLNVLVELVFTIVNLIVEKRFNAILESAKRISKINNRSYNI